MRLSLVCFLLLLCAAPAMAQTIADFEPDSTGSIRPGGATAHTVTDGAPQGKRYLRLTPATTQPSRAYVRLPVPKEADFSRGQTLRAQFRAPEAQVPVELRWLALDEKGRPIFQRRFTLQNGEKWIELDQPLNAWRWDDRFAGDWTEVREIALRIDSVSPGVDVDDIRLSGAAQPDDRAMWLMQLAFEQRPTRFVLEDQILVASDAIDVFGNPELSRLLQDMKRVRAFVRRAFEPVLRPTDGDGPLALLIFPDVPGQRGFIKRLGEQWRAEIAVAAGTGYTIQDIATSTYSKELGPRRPVYVHEATHAIVARDLRLLVGHGPHKPLQEGIASYVQACVHPDSLPRGQFVEKFAKPIDPQGRGSFKPLDKLFDSPPTISEYPQLASVIAYLLENDPQLLQGLIRGIADGQTAASVVERDGTTWQQFEQRWQAWGRMRFAAGTEAEAAFDAPQELR